MNSGRVRGISRPRVLLTRGRRQRRHLEVPELETLLLAGLEMTLNEEETLKTETYPTRLQFDNSGDEIVEATVHWRSPSNL
jgi:hypothetical protein